jgi:hypothetical protein
VRWTVDGFGTFKTVGEDGIFLGLLQHGIEIIMSHITNIFAVCLHTACMEGSEDLYLNQVLFHTNWLNHSGP